jgi:pimeloyl-ACP methyl ester carboxylesterase
MLTLVLLPGMDGTGTQFVPFIQALGDDFKVRVISYPVDKPLDYTELTGFVENLLPKQENYMLLGESFSGPVAISVAAARPPGLCGVILCCSFVRNPLPKLAKLKFIIDLLPFALPPKKILNHLLLGKFSTPTLFSSLQNSLAKVSAPTLKSRLKSVLSVDESAKLQQLTIPVLYLQAAYDRIIPKSAGNLIKATYPGSNLVTITAPHLLLQTKPEAALNKIKAFIAENHLADEFVQ